MNPDQQSIQSDPRAGRYKYSNGAKPLEGYTINRGIGIGGFGEVYFAINDAGKEVALKRIQRNLDVELRGVQNCLNLKHTNLIALWDIRTDHVGESWVVMEYVPGPSLRDIIEVSENGMPGHQIERWFDSIASAVEYLHNQGIVHRDLKPGNIFLDEDQNVIKIGDYGLSKFISCSQHSGQTETVGTFHYMAPEIGKGFYGKGVDIYAMGIVLYEMLTGRVPFFGESSQEIIMKHLTADVDLEQVPFDYRDAIEKSLLKDPELRFGSIAEMREHLPFGTENGSVHAPPQLLNPDRMSIRIEQRMPVNGSMKKTVGRPSRMPDIIENPTIEEGIKFGPLRDSTAGPRTDEEQVLYISEHEPRGESVATPSSDEPIAIAVKTGWDRFAQWWNDSAVSTPLKVSVLLVTGIVVAANSMWLLPLSLALGLVYLVYYGFRNFLNSTSENAESGPKRLGRREQQKVIQAGLRRQLSQQDIVTRATSLTASLLSSAVICLALNLLGLAITGSLLESSIGSWAVFAWSAVICTAGSWIVILLGRIFQQSDGEPITRRFIMLFVGLLVGGIAFGTAAYFNIDYAKLADPQFNPLHAPQFVIDNGGPLMANLLFFAVIFSVLRWWKLVDPTRRTRLSLWAVGLCLIWAAILSHFLDFAPVWNCMLVAVISIAIQLSSPWIPKQSRQAILNSFQKQMV